MVICPLLIWSLCLARNCGHIYRNALWQESERTKCIHSCPVIYEIFRETVAPWECMATKKWDR